MSGADQLGVLRQQHANKDEDDGVTEKREWGGGHTARVTR